jgi:hypothetical protein
MMSDWSIDDHHRKRRAQHFSPNKTEEYGHISQPDALMQMTLYIVVDMVNPLVQGRLFHPITLTEEDGHRMYGALFWHALRWLDEWH